MSNLLDTVMNIEVFVFIGLMIWLYFRPSHLERSHDAAPRDARDDC